ncbi:hypothetical protein K0M31_010825, partial [Melipona bicolor]
SETRSVELDPAGGDWFAISTHFGAIRFGRVYLGGDILQLAKRLAMHVNFERREIIVASDCAVSYGALTPAKRGGVDGFICDFQADYATLLNYHARRAPFNEAACRLRSRTGRPNRVDYPDPFYLSLSAVSLEP